MEWNSVCRLCGENKEPIHQDSANEGKNIKELVLKYLAIRIDADFDALPTLVCEFCRSVLLSFDEFAAKCHNTQMILSAVNVQGAKKEEDKEGIDKVESLPSQYNLRNVSVKLETLDVTIKTEDFSDFDNDDFLANMCPSPSTSKKKKSLKKKLKKDIVKKKKVGPTRKYTKKKLKLCDEPPVKEETKEETKEEAKEEKKPVACVNFVCQVCLVDMKGWRPLRRHMLTEHPGFKPQVLCICGKQLRSSSVIYYHDRKHDINKGIKCDHCDKCFANTHHLSIHASVHVKKEDYSFVCEVCSKKCATEMSLQSHRKLHDIPASVRFKYPCEHCKVRFTTPSSRDNHVKVVHEKLRPFICDTCGHTFSLKASLVNHVLIHTSEPTYQCMATNCMRRFRTERLLRRHRVTHQNLLFKCTVCPALLRSRQGLKNHMCMHEDKFKFECKICKKGFKRRNAYKGHLNLHTGATPYKCLWCPRTFTNNPNCRAHKKRKHPKELADYDATHKIKFEYDGDKQIILTTASSSHVYETEVNPTYE